MKGCGTEDRVSFSLGVQCGSDDARFIRIPTACAKCAREREREKDRGAHLCPAYFLTHMHYFRPTDISGKAARALLSVRRMHDARVASS